MYALARTGCRTRGVRVAGLHDLNCRRRSGAKGLRQQ